MNDRSHTDDFLAMLGHEMRNALSALRYSLDAWFMREPALLDDLRQIMERQVLQLTRLSDDLLDTARIAQGKLELRSEQIQIQRVIDDACEQVRPVIDRHRQTLAIDFPEEPIVVHGDASRLTQVFSNLLQNAAKFTQHHGKVRISLELQEESVAVRVRDNGRGIEKHLLTNTFAGGMRLNETRASGNDGLGIGLKLVNAIVELHGGSVAVHSEGLGQGSEFTVLLPLQNGLAHSQQTTNLPHFSSWQAPNGKHLPAYRIVVVDDDVDLGGLLAQLLRKIGQSVAVAENGEKAIQLVLKNRPEIVFLDLAMRDMNGYEIARRLREIPELNAMMLVALSGYGNEDQRLRAHNAGIDRYLVKPTSIASLTEVLHAVSASRSARI